MKIKLFPKNEQELSKLFVLIFPLTLLLSLTISFLKNAYFTFANLLPHNAIFNYGFLDRVDTQTSLGLVFGAALCLSFSYLFSKSLGRATVLFPLVFLTLLGIVGTEFLDILVNFFSQNSAYDLGNSSVLILLKILVVFGLFGLSSLNLLAKKESSIFASAQFIYGAVVFYLISLFIIRGELNVFSDIFLINSLYASTHIYVGVTFIYLAIIHFLMTRPLEAIMFNKTLSSIAFWGFLFLLPWTNFKYYYGSVLPNWIENISIYLSVSLVVPLLAFLVNYTKTIQSKEATENKSLGLMNFSVILFSITTIFHIVSSFENLLPILGITNFVNVIRFGYVGSLVMATISFSYYLIPKLFGREVAYSRLEDIVFNGFKISYLLVLINNTLIGVNSGYSWNAGANAGNPTIYGEGYEIVWNLISFNFSLNTFISLILLSSGFLYLISVLKAVSSGQVTTVEEMVYTNE
jgi:cbb3-type cytochrome oxidase subunit 1